MFRRTITLLFACCLLLARTGACLAETFDPGGDNATRFETAVNNLAQNDTLFIKGDFVLNRSVTISASNVTIEGEGRLIFESQNNKTTLFRITGNGVTVRNIGFILSADEAPFRAAIEPLGNNIRIEQNYFQGGSAGVRTIGGLPSGIQVYSNTFVDVPTGVAYNRDVERVFPVNQTSGQQKVNKALNPGHFDISFNSFSNSRVAAISIDCGNDGGDNDENNIAGRGNPGFPNLASPLRNQVNGQVTSFFGFDRNVQFNRGSIIYRNTITNSGTFGIAIARAMDIIVWENNISVANFGSSFRTGIHLENRSTLVTVGFNTIQLNGGGGTLSGIGLRSFTDYGNPIRFENGTRWCSLDSNDIRGSSAGGEVGIAGSGFFGINFINNRMNGAIDTVYSFFNNPGGQIGFNENRGNTPFNPVAP